MKKLPPTVWVLMLVSLCHIGLRTARAQVSSLTEPVTIQGKISSSRDQEFNLTTANGDLVVKLTESTKLIAESPIKVAEIKPGLFIAATAKPQPDGTFLASAVNVFREEERGLLEGHRPMTSLPGNTMTNATVESVDQLVVQDVKGPMLTLKFKGGAVKVFVPANAAIMQRVPGDKGMLKLGAIVRVVGTQTADKTINASQITIRAAAN